MRDSQIHSPLALRPGSTIAGSLGSR